MSDFLQKRKKDRQQNILTKQEEEHVCDLTKGLERREW